MVGVYKVDNPARTAATETGASTAAPRAPDDSLATLFDALNAAAISYCVAGNTNMLPRIPDNDIDIVCKRGSAAAITELVASFASRADGRIVQTLRYGADAIYHVVYLPLRDKRAAYLKVDICSDYVVRGRRWLDADWLLEGRIRRTAGATSFYVASADREFIYYLLKKIRKGEADGAALRHLSQLLAAELGCRATLDRYWSPATAEIIAHALAAESWTPIARNISAVRSELRSRLPRSNFIDGFREARRRLGRLVRPTGFVIALLGPPSVDKAALLSAVDDRLSALGRTSAHFYLAPTVFTTMSKARPDTSRGRTLGALHSIANLVRFAAAANLGWLISVWPRRVRSGMIFFDSYYHDIMIAPQRYRLSAPAWALRSLARLIPAPDLFLVLNTRSGGERKDVEHDEDVRQFAAYRALCDSLPSARPIDADRAMDELVSQCETHIVDAMASRKTLFMHVSP